MTDLTERKDVDLKETRYGSLSYDIPKVLSDLANLIRHKIRPYALAVHESGYLIPWQNREAIQEIVREAHIAINAKRAEKGQPSIPLTKVRVLKVDADQLPEVLDWAHEKMEEFTKEVAKSFETRMGRVVATVEKAIADAKLDVNDKAREIAAKKRAILRDLKKRVEDAEAAFFWFATTDNVKSALKASIGLFEAEIVALKEVTMLGDTALKQEQISGGAGKA